MADTAELMSHVKDADSFHLPFGQHLDVPQPFEALGIPFHLTKFMVVELLAAILLLMIFIPLARRIARGGPPQGKFWNFFEAMLVFMRDEVARPAIGKHDADRFLPYIWTVFFFILFCNLLGLVPWLGSPTGALGCTGALAIVAFVMCVGAGMKRFGPVGYIFGQVPAMEVPFVLAIFLKPMILAIELFGLGIKHFVLAVRLLANMFAGHLVLAVIIGFIAETAGLLIWYGVMPASVMGALGISLLELFVAFLQAYIFAFLSALFIGMAVHQH
ncbi:MAG: F0F1 ATP synthase subunit A [Pirellulales bacterium]|nr:F0F1 ATP synthase subunit A [Pirellulales bacterium]